MFTMVMRNSAMVLMIVLTLLDIANGHRVPTDQLILWDTDKAKEVLQFLYLSLFNLLCIMCCMNDDEIS